MYFKQIQLMGFKSFADRSTIKLGPGITCIVGPNGCGKSNVLDSMRWALGEQSPKALRGSHMQDVIFNGSETRQPTGMAEVSLTFDNADSKLPVDFAEVEITRRVYRSGESEYLINRAPCRLRDIQELVMDTGIGTNAYSLIGQGKIDLVLSSKPEDRRFVFEEAAGIIKYKSRKQAALRKLDSAAQNLLRLGDIIAEVQHQMRRLKRQVNAALRYRELTTILREFEIRGAWLKHRRLIEESEALRKLFATAQDSFEKASAETDTLEARREKLSVDRLEGERVLMSRREKVHEIEAEMEKVERTVALLQQQMTFSKEQQEQAASQREEFLSRAKGIEDQISAADARAEALRQELAALEAALAEKQTEHEKAATALSAADGRLDATRRQALDAVDARARANGEIESLAATLRSIDEQLETTRKNRSDRDERAVQLRALLEEAQQQEAAHQANLTAITEERDRLRQEQAALNKELQELQERWQQLREQKSRDEARLHSLRELRDSYEGFATGVRAIMLATQQKKAEIDGIIGPAGDLLSTEKTYERAIEAALGGNINNIVVETAESAKAAIAFLKKYQAGRVTFLPLDTIRPSQKDEINSVLGLPGVIGPAIDLVQFERHIEPAARYLLHNTVVVETLDDAIRIARRGNNDAYPRMVTLDGEMVSAAGAVTGGRTRHEGRGLLGRPAEIAELEETGRKTDARIAETSAKAQDRTDTARNTQRKIQEAEEKATGFRRALNEVGVVVAKRSTELDALTQSLEQMTNQEQALSARREELAARQAEAQERAAAMQTDDERLQQAATEAQTLANEARAAVTARAADLADMRVKLAERRQAFEEAERDQARERRDREEALREVERRKLMAEQHKANESKLEKDTAENLNRARVLSDQREAAHKEAVESQNELQKTVDELDGLNKLLRGLHDQTGHAREQVHKHEMALRHAEDQTVFFEERILTEYRVALRSLKEEEVGADELEEDERDQRIQEARDKIERLGEVNTMAIEEYAELEKRNDFLVTQLQDLTQARDTLLSVVARIDKTIRDMFLETFETVAENFRVFFRRLFNGGQARIYLLNEDDPLESGIEIEARPPGKKPQTIHLLSGGEQAMTAIALLFGVFKAKPSPFCVLDEVDAPLDDANVGRFLAMVEEFTDHSQFIIITHSKQTMSKADALYGVTMQERGVSQLVSVKFDEVDSETAA